MDDQHIPSILLVDDEEMIRTLLFRSLVDRGYGVVTAGTRAEAIEQLSSKEFDLLVCDKNLPDGSGFEVIDAAQRRGHRSESIVITAYSDTDSAIQAVALGVFRYVRKPFDLKALTMDIAKALETARLRADLARRTSELEKSNEALAESEAQYRLLFNSGNDAVFVYPLSDDGLPGKIIEVNDVACGWLDYTREEMFALTESELYPEEERTELAQRMSKLLVKKHILYEVNLLARDGRQILVEVSARLFDMGHRLAVMAIARDITERRHSEQERASLEEQFRASQKLEAIGRLAGGIAHDMNNVLGAVMGLAAAVEVESDESDGRKKDAQGILTACRKGRALTRDLLGFARKGKYLKESISFGDVVFEVKNILVRTIPRTITVETDIREDLDQIEGDSGQLKHALMNICINAVDAMNGRGTLSLSSRNLILDSSTASQYGDLPHGKYVELVIADTGIGMDDKTKALAFEPFYTTKAQGKGTGLGLAMVYGTIKNHGGTVRLESVPAEGTRVHLVLPIVKEEQRVSLIKPVLEKRVHGKTKDSQTVLLVDDEPMIRNAGRRLLERIGYKVVLASDGLEAIEIYREHKDDIWLVILDLIMPKMDGEEAFRALKEFDPDVLVLLSSGYSKEEKADDLLNEGAAAFIQKPFDLAALSDEIMRLR